MKAALLLLCSLCVFESKAQHPLLDSIPPSLPGGMATWRRYLEKELAMVPTKQHIRLRKQQVDSLETAVIDFTIDTIGAITQVRCTTPHNMTPFLLHKAMKIIEFGPRWIPATIGGKKVPYEQQQSVSFYLRSD